MGSNKELSDLDLELLGEKQSIPVHTNERPATSPSPVQVVSTKPPTRAGFTTKSRSSTSPDRVHVFGTTATAKAGFTIKTDRQLNEHGLVLTPKAPQKPATNATPLPSDRRPIVTPTTFQESVMRAQGISDKQSSTATQPSENRPMRTAKAPQKPATDTRDMSDNQGSIKPELEDSNESNALLTTDEVKELIRTRQKWGKPVEEISRKLSYAEAKNAELKDEHSKLEEQLKVELRETGKKLSSTEAENAELHDRYIRAEEALRVKVEQAVKDGRLAQANEESLEKLKTEYEALKTTHAVLLHKSKTQTNQVVGCEKKVTKVTKELADYKAAAEAKEARLQHSIENLKKGLEDSRKVIRSSGIEQRRAEIDGLSAHVDSFEESRRDWVETQNLLEDDLAAVKAVLDEKEQKILSMAEENKKLIQARKDLKKANLDLRNQQNTETGSTAKEAQASSKNNTQTDYSTDEDQLPSNKKPQCSLGEELFRDGGVQSGDEEASEGEEKTVTTLKYKPPVSSEGWTQTEEEQEEEEEEKTLTLPDYQPVSTGEGWIPMQAPKLERSPIFSLESAPVPPTIVPSQRPKLERSPVFAVDSAPVTIVRAHLLPKTTYSQGVQTEPRPTQSQGVQTELTATQPEKLQTEPKATQSQGVQTDPTATQSEAAQTEPKASKSQAVQTEPENTIILDEKTPWYMRKYTKAVFGTVMIGALLMLSLWAWSQCQAATKERKMWMLANDHAYRLSDEVIRKRAIALLQRTEDRAGLGWLTPEKVMTLHRGAHQAFARTFHPFVLPTRSISTPSLVQSAMPPTPATTSLGGWPAWSDSL